MCDPASITLAVVTVVSGGMKAYNSYQQGAAQKRAYDAQAENAREEGRRAYKAGEKQSELLQDSAKYEGQKQRRLSMEFSASQRATMAANGMDLSSVTAQDVASDTMSKTKLDELAIRYNADTKSWATMEDAKYKRWAGKYKGAQLNAAGRNAFGKGQRGAWMSLAETSVSLAFMGASGLLSEANKAGTLAERSAMSSSARSAGYGPSSLLRFR